MSLVVWSVVGLSAFVIVIDSTYYYYYILLFLYFTPQLFFLMFIGFHITTPLDSRFTVFLPDQSVAFYVYCLLHLPFQTPSLQFFWEQPKREEE